MTIFLIDRYLQAEGLTLKRDQLQLVGVTAMFTACKVIYKHCSKLSCVLRIAGSSFIRNYAGPIPLLNPFYYYFHYFIGSCIAGSFVSARTRTRRTRPARSRLPRCTTTRTRSRTIRTPKLQILKMISTFRITQYMEIFK